MQLNNRLIKYQNHLIKKNILSYLSFYGIMYLLVIIPYLLIDIINIPSDFIRIGMNHNGLTSVAGAAFFISPFMLLVFGIVEYYENFGMAFSLSATRKNYYISAMYSNTVMTIGFSVIATIMFFLDKGILGLMDMNVLTNFLVFDTAVDGPIKVFLILLGINLFSIGIGNFMGTLQYKFGYKFWIAFGIFFAAVFMFGIPSVLSGNTIAVYIIESIVNFARMMIESIGIVPTIVLYGSIQTIILYIGSFFILKTVNIGK